MKSCALLLTAACGLLLASCVIVPVPASLESVELDFEEDRQVLVGEKSLIIPQSPLTPPPERMECLLEALIDTEAGVGLGDVQQAQDAVFPWLEPATIPKKPEELTARLKNPQLRPKFDALDLRYLVIVGNLSYEDEGIEGPWGPRIMIPAGVGWAEDSAQMSALIWDLDVGELIGSLTVKASGTGGAITWLASVVFIPRTETKACSELGRQLALVLSGQPVSDPSQERTGFPKDAPER